ncbi:MAG: ATP-dependent DNA helicase RecG [Actinobacteria bacterium]|nr:ATP-dependent DNA helicase RecG [Actinomycetota bacterium]
MAVRSWLDAPVREVDGVSARAAGSLRDTFGIHRVRDLLEHFPHQDRYRDLGDVVPLREARLGAQVTVVGSIARWSVVRPRRRAGRRAMTIARATLVDAAGDRVEVPFFNQEWRARRQPQGTPAAVSGVLERFRGQLQLRSPRLTVLDGDGDGDPGADRVQAVYPATEALPSARIARYVGAALDRLPRVEDHLPDALRRRRGLVDYDTALRTIHRPGRLEHVDGARTRLVYDELLALQLGLQQRRHRLEAEEVGLAQPPVPGGLPARFDAGLPFQPTAAQSRALAEVGADLGRATPMHRLLQGDVGSGKTLVAAWAMLCAVDAGRQAVLMAPTEVLAEQHLRTLSELLAPIGVNAPAGPRLELVTGGTSTRPLRAALAGIAAGDVALVVGTHALLEDRVGFDDLGVVVIDEQHRFGVRHRARLRDKRRDERSPDVLVMTATPIPRSLALTLYGDLDVTVLDELPPGRGRVLTQVIPSDSSRRERLYDFIRERVAAGERAYVVCPTIAETDAVAGSPGRTAAEEMHARLSTRVFPDLRVALVHGRLPVDERHAAMDAFRRGEAQVLVATTVIEVGVDVPEATVMVVEDADRFGISQLHQLRGRVGRGAARSYCVLFSAEPDGNDRLGALASTGDGFRLAERDLELRGEGSLFDTRQSGLPDLKLAKLARDARWVAAARDEARRLVEADPHLRGLPALRAEVRRRYGAEHLAAMETG